MRRRYETGPSSSLLYVSALRVAELTGLDRDGLDLRPGRVLVVGKGSIERVVPMSDPAVDAVRAWMRTNPEPLWRMPSAGRCRRVTFAALSNAERQGDGPIRAMRVLPIFVEGGADLKVVPDFSAMRARPRPSGIRTSPEVGGWRCPRLLTEGVRVWCSAAGLLEQMRSAGAPSRFAVSGLPSYGAARRLRGSCSRPGKRFEVGPI
jgi:hypothetical protein